MGNVSALYKSRECASHIAPLKFSEANNTIYFYISRAEFLLLFIRYLLMMFLSIYFLTMFLPENNSYDKLLDVIILISPAVLSLIILPICMQRLAVQGLSPYLLIFHFFPLLMVLPINVLNFQLLGIFLLYLIFINIYVDTPTECERKKNWESTVPGEYPVCLTLIYFGILYLTFFILFELDDAVISLIFLSWFLFLLSKWHWQMVILNIVGGVGLYCLLSSDFMHIKYHKNIIFRALIKISLLDNILFFVFSLSLFINMLFLLEEWQRAKRPSYEE